MNIAICDNECDVVKSMAKITESLLISKGISAEVTLATTEQSLVYKGIKSHEIDVLFLDVDFGDYGINGVDFALELRKINKDFKLIFMTGYFEYAMLSFKCKTFDFIQKPIDETKIDSVIKRLIEDVSEAELGLFKVNKDYMIRTKDILFIERNKSKSTVYTKDSTYETCSSLNTLEHELPSSFIRVHRSYIVNREQISRISKANKSIYFENNSCCPLGQFYYYQ